METSKEKILKYMQQVLDSGITKALLVSKAPEEEGALIHAIPRIGVILDGQVEYSFFQENKLKTSVYKTGEAYYCGKNGYLYAPRHNYSKSISMCYYGEYIRAVYVEHNASAIEFEVYYHTNTALSVVGQKLLETLDEIVKDKIYAKNAPKLLELLMLITIQDVERSNPGGKTSSDRLWAEIDLYLRLHHNEPITRKLIAEKFRISPSYASHLIKRISGHDFTSLLTAYRLEHAAKLLRQTWQSIDEIAECCGFKYTSYFIIRFKKRYNITPHVFRNQTVKKEN